MFTCYVVFKDKLIGLQGEVQTVQSDLRKMELYIAQVQERREQRETQLKSSDNEIKDLGRKI